VGFHIWQRSTILFYKIRIRNLIALRITDDDDVFEGFALGAYIFDGLGIIGCGDNGHGFAIVNNMLQFIFSKHAACWNRDGPDFLPSEK